MLDQSVERRSKRLGELPIRTTFIYDAANELREEAIGGGWRFYYYDRAGNLVRQETFDAPSDTDFNSIWTAENQLKTFTLGATPTEAELALFHQAVADLQRADTESASVRSREAFA